MNLQKAAPSNVNRLWSSSNGYVTGNNKILWRQQQAESDNTIQDMAV